MIKPVVLRPWHYEDIEKQLIKTFREILFVPIVEIIAKSTVQAPAKIKFLNSLTDDLTKALTTGKIQYAGGIFSGKYSARTTKAIKDIGGKWDKKQSVFKMSPGDVPSFVKSAATTYQSNAQLAHKAIILRLEKVQKTLRESLDAHVVDSSRMVDTVTHEFKGVAKAIQVSPEIGEKAKETLSTDYNENMKLWIKNWCEEEIVALRRRVEENALEGYRFDRLIDMIQQRYDVSENKARFLARQETSLFMSKFQQQRFKEGGVQSYRWSTSHDERVRDDHKDLDGEVIFWDSPPIVDKRTGRRAHAGEDYQCRCVPIPIVNFSLVKK
jgi:SPP1 gp7 family putative phage head morphogenesis protein